MSDARFGAVFVVTVLAFSAVTLGFVSIIESDRAQVQPQLDTLKKALSALQAGAYPPSVSLPLINQTTTIRAIRMTWYLSPQAHQDRFDPSFPVVNQGDTVQLTLIDNDTVAHDFVLGPPYNFVVNATVPGLVNDLTRQTFTSPARNNSPGVIVSGTPGNVSATYTFVAKYSGVYEFVCTYHAQVGMIGYLVVLPNVAYGAKPPAGHPGTSTSALKVSLVIGAGSDTSSIGYSPKTITVVIGVNDTVSWVNNDNAPHTVTANDASFLSGNIAPGGSFTYTFTRAGTYSYHCVYHPWMTGTVVVKSS
jgi:plastocyanin